jgi:predicted metal-binding protein
MTPNADYESTDWWQRFAKAFVDGTCLPCPECDHQHDCFWCQLKGQAVCVPPNGSSEIGEDNAQVD